MDFNELVKKRYSVRKFEDKKVEKEKLIEIIKTAGYAPSAHNKQPWHFVIITEDEFLNKIKSVYNAKWFADVPAVIVALLDHEKSWKRDDGKNHGDVDLGIVIDHIMLSATSNELGTCCVCDFDAVKCKNIMELPDNVEPVALLPIGYPKYPTAKNKIRKDLEEIYSFQTYKK